MVWFAFSIEDQVEKYGAYVGIAAFFGLAVLSLLYFSQARELKRLREWAGRAPERARDLEQRVVAQATATVAKRGGAPAAQPAKPGQVGPARRLAEMPAPASQTAAAASGTRVAERAGGTNGAGPVPVVGPGGSVPAGAVNGAGAPAEDVEVPPEHGEIRASRGAATAASEGGEDVPEGGDSAGAATADPEEGADGPDRPQRDPDPGETRAWDAEEAAAATGARPVTRGEVPRMTPAQRVGVTPRPAPMPLSQTQAGASPSTGAGGGARRPAQPAARRGAQGPPGRSAGTVALLVGLAVLILGGGAFLGSQLLGGDDEPPPPNQSAPPSTQAQGAGGGEAASTPPPAETNVAVLNGTTFTGLAGQLADEVAAAGYERGVTETNTRDQTIEQSVVFYADGFRGSAREVGKVLSIDRARPLDSGTAAVAPGADVVVLAGADQAP